MNNKKKGGGGTKYSENDWYHKRKHGKVNLTVLTCLNKSYRAPLKYDDASFVILLIQIFSVTNDDYVF